MIDGKWSHIGRFKGPMLRDLAPPRPVEHHPCAECTQPLYDGACVIVDGGPQVSSEIGADELEHVLCPRTRQHHELDPPLDSGGACRQVYLLVVPESGS